MQNMCSKSSVRLAFQTPDGSCPEKFSVRRPAAGRTVPRADQRRVAVLAIVVSMALSVVWAPRLLATTPPGEGRTHVVTQGETLWGVARLHAPEHIDPRAFVDQVRKLNQLSTARLSPGQELRLPPHN